MLPHPPCSRLKTNSKPCQCPGDRRDAKGLPVCHVHDPNGKAYQNFTAGRTVEKASRQTRAMAKWKEAGGLARASHAPKPLEPSPSSPVGYTDLEARACLEAWNTLGWKKWESYSPSLTYRLLHEELVRQGWWVTRDGVFYLEAGRPIQRSSGSSTLEAIARAFTNRQRPSSLETPTLETPVLEQASSIQPPKASSLETYSSTLPPIQLDPNWTDPCPFEAGE
jgi:hypothetical protein